MNSFLVSIQIYLPLAKTPKATYFVATACILVFMAQIVNKHYFEKGIQNFRAAYKDKELIDFLSLFKNAGEHQEERFEQLN